MALMQWQDSYSVGEPSLDADHKRLIAIINRIDAAERDGAPVDWVLDELADYVRYHFAREESALERSGYPDLVEHRAGHARFVEWLKTLQRTYQLAPDARFYLAATVNEYLREWLTHHILESDMAYADHLAEHGGGGL